LLAALACDGGNGIHAGQLTMWRPGLARPFLANFQEEPIRPQRQSQFKVRSLASQSNGRRFTVTVQDWRSLLQRHRSVAGLD
jgi:hypothetical protein